MRSAPRLGREGAGLALASATAALLAASIQYGPLEGLPHVADELAYGLQARLLAAGRLLGPEPRAPSLLLYPFVDPRGGLHGVFPPGWPLLLAFFGRLGLPQGLVNPLLLGAVPPLLGLLARRSLGAGAALPAAWVAALSPGLLVLGASRMSQTSTLLALLVLALQAAAEHPGRREAWIGGIAWAYVLLARPFDALVAGTPLALALLLRGGRALLPRLAAPPALALAALLAYNQALTGAPLRFPSQDFYDWFFPERPGCDRLGFGPGVGCAGGDYTPGQGLRDLSRQLLTYDRLFLGLPGGALLAALGLPRLRRRPELLALLLLPLAYLFYWSPGLAYGARFEHPLYLVLPLGLAALLQRLPRRLLPLLALGLLAPLYGLRRASAELADRYWCVDGSLRDELERAGVGRAVVFLYAEGRREAAWPYLGIPDAPGERFTCDPLLESGDGFALAGPDEQGRWIFRHLPAEPEQARAYREAFYPEREAWVDLHRLDTDQRRLVPLDALLAARAAGGP